MDKEQKLLIMAWWEKLGPLVRKFSRETHLLGVDKDDIKQECFLQLEKALENYDESYGVPFESYYKIVLSGWRSNQNKVKRDEVAFEEEQFLSLKDERTDIQAEVERKVLIEKSLTYIEVLEAMDRQIIKAFYLENKKLGEIALEIGLGRKAVEARKKKALNQLRKEIEGELVEVGTSRS